MKRDRDETNIFRDRYEGSHLVRVGDEYVAGVRDALISEKDRDRERTRSKRERERETLLEILTKAEIYRKKFGKRRDEKV